MKYFIEAGAMAVRRVKPADMKKIAKATGAHVVVTMADMEGNEVFEEKWLGNAEEVRKTNTPHHAWRPYADAYLDDTY